MKTIVETIIMKMVNNIYRMLTPSLQNRRMLFDCDNLTYFYQDYDKDGRLSIEDYATAVKNDTLLLEAFGPCLPFKKVSLHCPMELKSSYATID